MGEKRVNKNQKTEHGSQSVGENAHDSTFPRLAHQFREYSHTGQFRQAALVEQMLNLTHQVNKNM